MEVGGGLVEGEMWTEPRAEGKGVTVYSSVQVVTSWGSGGGGRLGVC